MCKKRSLAALAILFSHFFRPNPGVSGTPAICTYAPGVGPPATYSYTTIYIYVCMYINISIYISRGGAPDTHTHMYTCIQILINTCA